VDDRRALRFFLDDETTGGQEQASGAAAGIRIYDAALTSDEVAERCAERWGAPCVPPMETYLAQVREICTSASDAFEASVETPDPADDEALARWSLSAAAASEEVLFQMRTLPRPGEDRARLDRFYALAELQTDLLDRAATAGESGSPAKARRLEERRIDVTHAKDRLMPRLWTCPVRLPA
jgi:hypothetical protein